MVVRIPRKILEEMSQHVVKTYPDEGCGLLIGIINSGAREIVKCIPMANVYAGPRKNRYSIDPLEYMKIEDQHYRIGLLVIGVFHSHPDAPAVPSMYDQEHAVPSFSYVILSVRSGKIEEIAAWRINESTWKFEEEQLEIV